jgi:hypothetical protein
MAHGNLICNESNGDEVFFFFFIILFLLAFFFFFVIFFFIAMMEMEYLICIELKIANLCECFY